MCNIFTFSSRVPANANACIKRLCGWLLLTPLAGLPSALMASGGILEDIATDAFANAYFIPDERRGNLHAHLIFHRGEFHNPAEEGLAHYVEHLAWLNTFNDSDTSRHANAWTTLHATGYWLELDDTNYKSRLQRLLSVVDPWTLDERFMLEERSVIEQEYNNYYLENPYLDINLEKTRALLGETDYARSVIGTPTSIRQFDLDQARGLHQRSHQLTHATLMITGDSKPGELGRWLKSLKLPALEQPKVASTHEPIDLPVLVDIQDITSASVPGPTLYVEKLVHYDQCGTPAQCDIAFRIVQSVIDSSLPGGIANALRYENFIARNFSFDLHGLGQSSVVMSFVAEPDLGVSLDELEDAFFAAWSATSDGGIPRATVERIRKRIRDDLHGIMDGPAHALNLALEQMRSGIPVYSPQEQRAALQAVDYEQVMNMIESLHGGDGRLVVRRVRKLE